MSVRLTFDRLAVAALFLAILASACLMPAQNDSWWHLRVGQEMWRIGSPLYTDTFSFTVPGAVWRNHEWLTELGFYALYSVGGMPLLTFVAALIVTLAWMISWLMMTGDPKWRVLLVGLALPANAVEWSIRPQLVTLFFLPLVTWCLLRGKLRWLPPLFLLWANLHAGFMAGLVVMAVMSATMVLQDRSRWPALTVMLALSALATLLNPLGTRLWSAVFEALGRGASIGISEFRSAQLLAPEDLPFWILAALLAGLCLRRALPISNLQSTISNSQLPLVAAALVLMPASLRYGRNIPLFLLLAVPAITQLLAMESTTAAIPRPARREHATLNAAVLVALIMLAVGGVTYAWQRPVKRLQWQPVSVGAIHAVAACPGQLYNRYDDGGFLLWFVPSRRVFIDSRQDPYPLELLHEHLRSENSGDYAGIFARYDIHCAFLPPTSAIARNLVRDRWRPVYQDTQWMVLDDGSR